MAEYIEREAVQEILKKRSVGTWRGTPCYPDEIRQASKDVDAIPAADVAPVVRAKWIAVEDPVNTVYDCSACDETFCFIEGDPRENLYSYCPNCGARTDGEG